MIAIAAVVGNSFYNFDLEQWGFAINQGESWTSYFKRLQKHFTDEAEKIKKARQKSKFSHPSFKK